MYLMAAPERARPVRQGDRAERLHDLDAGAAQRRLMAASPAEAVGAVAGRTSWARATSPACARWTPQHITDGAAARGLSSRSSPSTAACCRASSSRCSIAASRRRCRCSPASTAARSARCASSRRRRPPTRRPMKQQIRERYGDLADAFLKLYPAGDLAGEHAARRRATRCTAGPPSGWCAKQTAVGVPSFLYLLRSRLSGRRRRRACTPSTPARFPYVFGTTDETPPHWPQVPADAARGAALRRDARATGRRSRATARRAPRASRHGRPTAPSAPTWPSRTRRGRRRICCPACTSSTSRSCAAAARRAASRGTGTSASSSPPLPRRGAAMPMIDGAMQSFALTLDKFLEHAAKWHPHAEVVTAREGGRVDRIGYAELDRAQPQGVGGARGLRRARRRSRRDAGLEHAGACRSLVRDHGHGRGLPHAQSAPHLPRSSRRWSRSPARACWSSAPTSLPLAREIAEARRRSNACCSSMARRSRDAIAGGRSAMRARAADRARARRRRLGRLRRDRALRPVLHLGHDRRAQGRDLHASRRASCTRCACCRPTSWRSRARDSVLAVVPMFHANAWGLPFAAPAAGAKLVLPGRQTDGAQPGRADQCARR